MMKLLAVDMDETAVNSKHKMTRATRKAFGEAFRRGILVVPVTGRCLEGIPTALRGMKELSYIITSNGAKVYDWKGKEVLYRKLISNETACDVLHLCKAYKLGVAIHMEGACYDNSKIHALYRKYVYHHDFKERELVKDLEQFVKDQEKPIEKIHIFSKNRDEFQELKRRLDAFDDLEVAMATQGWYMEVTHRDAQKGLALEYLCKHLNIGLDEVMAIGDNRNDRSMLIRAGYSVAMDNADEEIKEIAKYVTASNDENGVAKVIYEKLLSL